MTSNIGSHLIQEYADKDRQDMEAAVKAALRANFKPEFLNRIDEIIIFHNLTPDQIGEIVAIQMKRLQHRLSERNIELMLSRSALEFLAQKGFDPIYGARPLKRAIQKYIENPLSMEILKGNIPDGTKINAELINGKMEFNPN